MIPAGSFTRLPLNKESTFILIRRCNTPYRIKLDDPPFTIMGRIIPGCYTAGDIEFHSTAFFKFHFRRHTVVNGSDLVVGCAFRAWGVMGDKVRDIVGRILLGDIQEVNFFYLILNIIGQ